MHCAKKQLMDETRNSNVDKQESRWNDIRTRPFNIVASLVGLIRARRFTIGTKTDVL